MSSSGSRIYSCSLRPGSDFDLNTARIHAMVADTLFPCTLERYLYDSELQTQTSNQETFGKSPAINNNHSKISQQSEIREMLTLAIESSGLHSAVALLRGEELLQETELPRGTGGRGSGSPAAAVEATLLKAGLAITDLNLIAVSTGPGSYTGLRVGTSFAKTLAWATDIPTVAVPSLEALGMETARRNKAEVIVSTADAFRGQIYLRVMICSGNSPGLKSITEDQVIDPATIGSLLSKLPEEHLREKKLAIAGSALSKYPEIINDSLSAAKVKAVILTDIFPSPLAVGRIGLSRFAAGMTVTCHELRPVYLRRTEAEERLEAHTR
jgi:tRNA threonylcarbamoyladenosine biosynthesis protein TsaB